MARSAESRAALKAMKVAWVENLPARIKAEMQAAVVEAAEKTAGTMRRLVPVDEGDLRDSIVVTPPGATTPAYSQPGGSMTAGPLMAVITVGNTKVRYPHLVEYGTRKSPAQPYFWPSWRAEVKGMRRRLATAFRKAFKKHGGSAT